MSINAQYRKWAAGTGSGVGAGAAGGVGGAGPFGVGPFGVGPAGAGPAGSGPAGVGPAGGGANNDDCTNRAGSASSTAKEYVESLHQNNKVTLLYGKNNVLVLPVSSVSFLVGRRTIYRIDCQLLAIYSYPFYND